MKRRNEEVVRGVMHGCNALHHRAMVVVAVGDLSKRQLDDFAVVTQSAQRDRAHARIAGPLCALAPACVDDTAVYTRDQVRATGGDDRFETWLDIDIDIDIDSAPGQRVLASPRAHDGR